MFMTANGSRSVLMPLLATQSFALSTTVLGDIPSNFSCFLAIQLQHLPLCCARPYMQGTYCTNLVARVKKIKQYETSPALLTFVAD